jgi:hypothetical protein
LQTGQSSDQQDEAAADQRQKPAVTDARRAEDEMDMVFTALDDAAEKISVDALDRRRGTVDGKMPIRIATVSDDQEPPARRGGVYPQFARLLVKERGVSRFAALHVHGMRHQGRRFHVDALDVHRWIVAHLCMVHQPHARQRIRHLKPEIVRAAQTRE